MLSEIVSKLFRQKFSGFRQKHKSSKSCKKYRLIPAKIKTHTMSFLVHFIVSSLTLSVSIKRVFDSKDTTELSQSIPEANDYGRRKIDLAGKRYIEKYRV